MLYTGMSTFPLCKAMVLMMTTMAACVGVFACVQSVHVSC